MSTDGKIVILVMRASLCMLVVAGCARTSVRGYLKPGLTVSHVSSIAVLPFDNISGHPDADKKIVNLLLTELVRTGLFQMAEMGEVEKSLRSLRIRTTAEIDSSKLQELREQLNVQAIIIGSVDEYDLLQEGGRSIPVVAVSARMLDARTGDILWAVSHTHDGDDWETVFGFGRIVSISQLAQIVVSEMVESLVRELSSPSEAEAMRSQG